MVKQRLALLALMLVSITMVGCTTTQKWMAGGAALGATAGGLWGSHGGGLLNAGEGAAIGAVTGATVGALVGDMKDEAATKAKIADLEEQNRNLQAQLQACQNDLEAARRRIAELEAQVKSLQDQLANAGGSRMEMSLLSDVLFRPGSNKLSDEGVRILNEAAEKIKTDHAGKFIMVEGHTDSDPIRVSRWTDNWELGSARALAVLRQLIKAGVDPAKASAATFSQYQPVADNSSVEGKNQNRRAVIVIYTGWPK